MNMCVHKYGDTLICLIKLQNMGWIGKSRVFRDVYLKDLAKKIHTVEPHRPAVKKTISKKTITFINGRFVYKGKGMVKYITVLEHYNTHKRLFHVWRYNRRNQNPKIDEEKNNALTKCKQATNSYSQNSAQEAEDRAPQTARKAMG